MLALSWLLEKLEGLRSLKRGGEVEKESAKYSPTQIGKSGLKILEKPPHDVYMHHSVFES